MIGGGWPARATVRSNRRSSVRHSVEPRHHGGDETQDVVAALGQLFLLAVQQGEVEVAAAQLRRTVSDGVPRSQRVARQARERRRVDTLALHVADDQRHRVAGAAASSKSPLRSWLPWPARVRVASCRPGTGSERLRQEAAFELRAGPGERRHALRGIGQQARVILAATCTRGVVVGRAARRATRRRAMPRAGCPRAVHAARSRSLGHECTRPPRTASRPPLRSVEHRGRISPPTTTFEMPSSDRAPRRGGGTVIELDPQLGEFEHDIASRSALAGPPSVASSSPRSSARVIGWFETR